MERDIKEASSMLKSSKKEVEDIKNNWNLSTEAAEDFLKVQEKLTQALKEMEMWWRTTGEKFQRIEGILAEKEMSIEDLRSVKDLPETYSRLLRNYDDWLQVGKDHGFFS